MLLITRWCWWTLTGLFLGAALWGFQDHNIIMFIPGLWGTLWFSTCALLPERALTRRERLYERSRTSNQRSTGRAAGVHTGSSPGGRQHGGVSQLSDAPGWGRTMRLHGAGGLPYRQPDGAGLDDPGATDRTRIDLYRTF